jgi:hypothetical protein
MARLQNWRFLLGPNECRTELMGIAINQANRQHFYLHYLIVSVDFRQSSTDTQLSNTFAATGNVEGHQS